LVHKINKKTIADRWFYFCPILFGLAYSQSALFSENQNTKFISGLALAGYRDVAADWMTHITDPFPLFSSLLKWQYQLLGLYTGAHFSFLLLVSIYGISGVWLAKSLFAHNEDRRRVLLVFSLIWLFIHTIGLRGLWLDFFPEGLSGQYMLGSYYQPCVFGVLLLTGTATYISGRPILAAVCFVLAPLFHPTYLISSALIATAITALPANQSLGIGWGKRLLFLSLVVLVLTPYAAWSYASLTSGDPLVRDKAHQLLAETRIPNHAILSAWSISRTVKFFIVGLVAAWLRRKQLVGQLLLVMLLVVAATILWAIMDKNSTLAVIAPWRVSVFLAPLSWVVLLAAVAEWLTREISKESYISLSVLKRASIIAVTLACIAGIADVISDYQDKIEKKYYPVSRFLVNYHKPGNKYLIPPDQKHIRLEAGVPVYVTWKSHPTKDSEFLEWYKRIETARAIYEKRTDRKQSEISDLIESNSVTHVIWPISKEEFPFSQMGQQVYRDSYYSLWDMR
jgi:hypothetical protein